MSHTPLSWPDEGAGVADCRLDGARARSCGERPDSQAGADKRRREHIPIARGTAGIKAKQLCQGGRPAVHTSACTRERQRAPSLAPAGSRYLWLRVLHDDTKAGSSVAKCGAPTKTGAVPAEGEDRHVPVLPVHRGMRSAYGALAQREGSRGRRSAREKRYLWADIQR